MQRFCNAWRVRNLLVMALRLNESTERIVSLHTRQLRPTTNLHPHLQHILHSSCVVDNARELTCQLPQISMPKEVHLRQLAT